ncbi:hypothetical protein ACIRU8_27710 [Streptomyces sp. NPDC101175]|uniref:hypothetical protein n=1 Tax=Streptomyces sp. NPDC101175 TaxID=3366123 RepID=UPI003834304A
MVLLVALSLLVVIVLAGCACVWWASNGGPRWVRAVAVVTLAAGELVRADAKRKTRRSQDSSATDG